jgi:hypothetical protein
MLVCAIISIVNIALPSTVIQLVHAIKGYIVLVLEIQLKPLPDRRPRYPLTYNTERLQCRLLGP